jgi:predicted NBD/HSP70 family sugar kinase
VNFNEYTLIGVDGGATKVSGWIVNFLEKEQSFTLSEHHSERQYTSINGHITDFTPVKISQQLSQRESGNIHITDDEFIQGQSYIEAAACVIIDLFEKGNRNPVLIGIGMPGLKTSDQRGINTIANGPRMLDYCTSLENYLKASGVEFLSPVARLGSDADYCGIGEFYAVEGSFRNVKNAYYLGGGTGAADALLLKGELVPFDMIQSWMAKTWEMKNELGLSFERYASACGLQFIYAGHSNKSLNSLNKSYIYPPQIASLAEEGEEAAVKSCKETAIYLAQLIFERISTLFCGSLGHIKFINPERKPLDSAHKYRGEIFEKIVFGQRFGELMASPTGHKVLTEPFLEELSGLIKKTERIPEQIMKIYLQDGAFNTEIVAFSKLREAPALGAGVDAHLLHFNR